MGMLRGAGVWGSGCGPPMGGQLSGSPSRVSPHPQPKEHSKCLGEGKPGAGGRQCRGSKIPPCPRAMNSTLRGPSQTSVHKGVRTRTVADPKDCDL